MELTEQTWQWLIDGDVETLGLWVFMQKDGRVIKKIADKLDAIEDIPTLVSASLVLAQKAKTMKSSPIFAYSMACRLERAVRASLIKRLDRC